MTSAVDHSGTYAVRSACSRVSDSLQTQSWSPGPLGLTETSSHCGWSCWKPSTRLFSEEEMSSTLAKNQLKSVGFEFMEMFYQLVQQQRTSHIRFRWNGGTRIKCFLILFEPVWDQRVSNVFVQHFSKPLYWQSWCYGYNSLMSSWLIVTFSRSELGDNTVHI